MDTPVEFFIKGARAETTESLRDFAERKLTFAVARLAHRIRRITVRLVDENGPRRGVDSRASITAELVDGRQLFVEATAAWPFAALTSAAARLGELLRRDTRRRVAHRDGSAAAVRSI